MPRASMVTDAGVVPGWTVRRRFAQSLEAAGVATRIFDGVEGNPTEANIEQGRAAYKEHQADGVVCVGGGSPMDAGKLVGAARPRVAAPFEELDDAIDGGRHIPADLPPIIALPTTAGTGSEVGRSGVVTLRSSATGRR